MQIQFVWTLQTSVEQALLYREVLLSCIQYTGSWFY